MPAEVCPARPTTAVAERPLVTPADTTRPGAGGEGWGHVLSPCESSLHMATAADSLHVLVMVCLIAEEVVIVQRRISAVHAHQGAGAGQTPRADEVRYVPLRLMSVAVPGSVQTRSRTVAADEATVTAVSSPQLVVLYSKLSPTGGAGDEGAASSRGDRLVWHSEPPFGVPRPRLLLTARGYLYA
jgi:hypothetical protein